MLRHDGHDGLREKFLVVLHNYVILKKAVIIMLLGI